jgi:nitrate/nitrite transporter NarK
VIMFLISPVWGLLADRIGRTRRKIQNPNL